TQWVAAGARIVGGCCRVRPADIAAVRRACNRREKSAENPQ
ncbi:MAG: homocysteine S-methyltransferase family protein, partial [Mycobacterium sp.]